MHGGNDQQYAGLKLHGPKRWQRAVGSGLCTIMWLWVMHRARNDGPVVMGWRHPWDGHGHGHGGSHGGGGHIEEHKRQQEEEDMPMTPLVKGEGVAARPNKKKVAPEEKIHSLSDSRYLQKAVKDGPSAFSREGHRAELKSAITSAEKSHDDAKKSRNAVSKAEPKAQKQSHEKAVTPSKKQPILKNAHKSHDYPHSQDKKPSVEVKEAGPKVKQPPADRANQISWEQQMLRRAIEQHQKVLSLLKDDE